MVDTEEITLKIEALPNQKVRFSKEDAVSDSIRGYLYYKDGEWKFEEIVYCGCRGHKYSKKLVKADDFIIGLSLESPHKDEFDSNDKHLLPAQGKTGENIKKQIESIAKKLELDQKHRYVLLLLNPIQYQTSCYSQLKDKKEYSILSKNKKDKIRNEVFLELFLKKGLKTNFKARLRKYAGKNLKILINCCTKNLKSTVADVIVKSFSGTNIEYYEGYHPSCWHFFKGGKISKGKQLQITSESFFE